MNLNIKRTIFAILTIATCIIIFIFSNQNGEKSGLTSRGFVRKIVEITGITNNLNETEKEELIENCQFVVRKLAHFSIYTILGINALGFINTYTKISLKKQCFLDAYMQHQMNSIKCFQMEELHPKKMCA